MLRCVSRVSRLIPVPSIATVDDKLLVELIGRAKRRVLLVSPGVSLLVAQALCNAWRTLPATAVSIVLDVDPEVCRLGYGTESALTLLQQTASAVGQTLCHEPGVRIALLVADDRTVIFSPTPLLIEAQPAVNLHDDPSLFELEEVYPAPPKPNAIFLGEPPPSLASDLGLTASGAATRTVGLDSVSPSKVSELKADLAKNPPLAFNVSRYERVFNAQIEFVELSVVGCSVSKHTVALPPYLMGLDDDEKTRRHLRNSFKVIGEGDTVDEAGTLSEQAIHKKRKEICETYLRPLKGYGVAILRTNRTAFESDVEGLRKLVEAFAGGLKAKLEKIIQLNVSMLVDTLLPAVMKNVPRHWTATLGKSPDAQACRRQLTTELCSIVGNAEDLVSAMKVSVIFKGVTYQNLTEKDFIEIAKEQFPNLRLLDEYDAVRGEHAT